MVITNIFRNQISANLPKFLNVRLIKLKIPFLYFRSLLSKTQQKFEDLKMSSCFSDETCNISRKDRIIVAVYNPLSKTMSPVIRLPVDHTDFSVTGPESKCVYLSGKYYSEFSCKSTIKSDLLS